MPNNVMWLLMMIVIFTAILYEMKHTEGPRL